MNVVADASVLIGLSSIQKLGVLRERFPEGIFIPPAVWKEVVEEGRERPGAREVAGADWIRVQEFIEQGIADLLRMELDDGEAAAIALAYEIQADVVLIDEQDARQAAQQLGLRVLGAIGILTWAKQNGKIISLRVALDELREKGKFRISQKLYERALSIVGEG